MKEKFKKIKEKAKIHIEIIKQDVKEFLDENKDIIIGWGIVGGLFTLSLMVGAASNKSGYVYSDTPRTIPYVPLSNAIEDNKDRDNSDSHYDSIPDSLQTDDINIVSVSSIDGLVYSMQGEVRASELGNFGECLVDEYGFDENELVMLEIKYLCEDEEEDSDDE